MTSQASWPRKDEGHRREHPDTPDTARAFRELATLPPGPRQDRLREELVRAWLPMAYRLANRYRERGEDLEDLKQVAALGLVKAVRRFDPTLGHAFASYAVPVLTGEIKKHFRDHTWDVHVPRRVQDLRNRVRRALHELAPDDSRPPPVEVLAEHLDLTPDEVLDGLGALHGHSVLSLDAPSPGEEEGRTLLTGLGAIEPGYDHVIRRESVRAGLRCLSDRERRVLHLRFYREMSQSAIADELDISQMHVSRILRRTCARLRRKVEDQPPPDTSESRTTTTTGGGSSTRAVGRRGGWHPPWTFGPPTGPWAAATLRAGRRARTAAAGKASPGPYARDGRPRRTPPAPPQLGATHGS